MEFKKTGVNYDYILALEYENKKVSIVQYPIKRHNREIDIALKYLDDENADAYDIYNSLRCCLDSDKKYNYCLKHEYNAKYIAPIAPVKFDNYKLRGKIASIVEAKTKQLPIKDRHNYEKIEQIRQSVWKNHYRQIRKDKELLIERALPYVYAYDYETALFNNHVEERSIIFSHERHGDGRDTKYKENTVEHRVNDDISIRVETNFCYGNSSYFHVIVLYKGIALLPYSVWVRYYYAGISQLLSYTRSYERNRESWHTCMNFLKAFINSALSDSESFIHNEVMTEVDGLMNGLEEIFKYDEERFEKEIKVKKRPGDERYIGILTARYATDSDEELYKIAPREISMIYKMEKISGALRFLDSLRKIKDIYSEVSDAIYRIIELNQLILPDVENAIPPVEEEIKKLNAVLSPLQKRLNSCEVDLDKMQKYKKSLEKRFEKVHSKKYEKKITETMEKCIELRNAIRVLEHRISELTNNKNKRVSVLRKLINYKSLILKYAL